MNDPGFVDEDGYTLALAKQSVGIGWHPLLERLFLYLEDNKNIREIGRIRIVQVKEKFGGLTIYTGACPGFESGVIAGLEMASHFICELCGNAGHSRGHNEGRGWIRTLCDQCHEQTRLKNM